MSYDSLPVLARYDTAHNASYSSWPPASFLHGDETECPMRQAVILGLLVEPIITRGHGSSLHSGMQTAEVGLFQLSFLLRPYGLPKFRDRSFSQFRIPANFLRGAQSLRFSLFFPCSSCENEKRSRTREISCVHEAKKCNSVRLKSSFLSNFDSNTMIIYSRP